jgi:hypothetical protein
MVLPMLGGGPLTEDHAALWLAVLELLSHLQRKTGAGRMELLWAVDAAMQTSHDARGEPVGGRGAASPASVDDASDITLGCHLLSSIGRPPAYMYATSAGATGQKKEQLLGPRHGPHGAEVEAQSQTQLPGRSPRQQQQPDSKYTATSWKPLNPLAELNAAFNSTPLDGAPLNVLNQRAFGGPLLPPPSLQRALPGKQLTAKKLTVPMQESKAGAPSQKQLPRPPKQQQDLVKPDWVKPDSRYSTTVVSWQPAPATNVLRQNTFGDVLLDKPSSSVQRAPPAKKLAAKVSGPHTSARRRFGSPSAFFPCPSS